VKLLTPIKAIRAKCLDCCCNQRKEVRLCPIPDCSLYPYRFGHHPKLKGKGGQSREFLAKISKVARRKKRKQ